MYLSTDDPGSVAPLRARDVFSADLHGETVLLHGGQLHVLNPTASITWKCLDGRTTIAEIAEEVSVAFNLDQSQVLDELTALVAELAADGLITTAPGGPNSAAEPAGDVDASARSTGAETLEPPRPASP